MKWNEEFQVSINDTDAAGNASPSAVLGYIQTAADLHFCEIGQGGDEMRRNGMAFLLSRLSISLYAPLRAHDRIRVETWPCESKGVIFTRCNRVYRGDEVVAEAITCWALIDINSKKILKTDAIEINAEMHELLQIDVPMRVRIPRDANLKLVGEHTVVYSDIDINGHMHNTNYPDFFCDYIPNMQEKRVLNMTVSYLKEAPFGDNLKVYMLEDDGSYLFRLVRGDGTVCTEAEIVIDEAE